MLFFFFFGAPFFFTNQAKIFLAGVLIPAWYSHAARLGCLQAPARKQGDGSWRCSCSKRPRRGEVPRGPEMGVANSENRKTKMGCPIAKWNHGPKPAVCPCCLILSHTQLGVAQKWGQSVGASSGDGRDLEGLLAAWQFPFLPWLWLKTNEISQGKGLEGLRRHTGVLFGCFARGIDCDSWFNWWLNHQPGPSVSPKRTPMLRQLCTVLARVYSADRQSWPSNLPE